MIKKKINKPMSTMLIAMAILFGAIFLYKAFISLMIKRSLGNQSTIVPVSMTSVDYSWWQPKLTASGSLRAIRGVSVTTELAGMVQKIYFTPGAHVKEGDLLLQLNADAEIGQLESLQANAELARITYERDKAQYAVQAVSKQTLDTDWQNLKSLKGQVAQQIATVAKKSIRAPFSGRLGINQVNPGQYINTGDAIVTLQTMNPIYADFYIPQQFLSQLKMGQKVTVITNSQLSKAFTGNITTINPLVDSDTRNVQVEATLPNPKEALTPGIYVTVEVTTEKPQQYLTLPQTAVAFNSYGNIVYVIKETGKNEKGQPILIANQVFVVTGETRGEQIQILKGLKKGDKVVTSGQLKLKNRSQVSINNSLQPTNNPAPILSNNHLG